MMLGVGVSVASSVGYLVRNSLILRLSVGSVGWLKNLSYREGSLTTNITCGGKTPPLRLEGAGGR